MDTDVRLAVVLFNLGGPDRPEAVEPFLRNLFSDPAILSLPGLIGLRWPALLRPVGPRLPGKFMPRLAADLPSWKKRNRRLSRWRLCWSGRGLMRALYRDAGLETIQRRNCASSFGLGAGTHDHASALSSVLDHDERILCARLVCGCP